MINENEKQTPSGDSSGATSCSVCVNCMRKITPEMESPEKDTCAECLIYREGVQQQDSENRRQIITREMAMDAGSPEMEGMEVQW
jgi:hypothetical protein